MFASFLAAVVDLSRRFAWAVVIAALILGVGLGAYVAKNISINTDINQLLSPELPWRQQERAMEEAFPQKVDNIVIVIDSDNGTQADAAAAALAAKLASMPDKFKSVTRPDALSFFRTNGLLYMSREELGATLDQIAQAQPMLGMIVTDPSVRGLFGMIGMMAQGAEAGATDAAQIERPFAEITRTINAALKGQTRPLDFRQMMPESSNTNLMRELRKYIIAKPVLNYAALQPGAEATKTVRNVAAELGLTPDNGVRVRMTGSVPLNDDEFASVAEGAGLTTSLSGILVFALLFLALRTWRIVLPITLTLIVGLVASTAFATAAVGSLNLISVAFAVMFIGIAVDFGIQFGVRYRDQHHKEPDHAKAMANTARVIAAPLAMAAGATSLGFLAFTPTEYRGVSELGLIAGIGMIIAFVLNITLLPALMTLTKPPAEKHAVGYQKLARLNQFLVTRGKLLLPALILLAVVGVLAAAQVRFDFDPLNLKDPKTESVQTMFEAIQDPDSDAYAAELLVPNETEAQQMAAKLEVLPEVDHVMTLNSFIPEHQDEKLAMIADTASLLAPTLALPPLPPADAAADIEATRKTASQVRAIADKFPFAKALADALDQVAANPTPELLARLQSSLVVPLQTKVGEIQGVLSAKPISIADIPPELSRDWVAPDGRWLVKIFPKRAADNNPRDAQVLTRFLDAVEKVAPGVSGTPVSIRESGRTIISAFVHAAVYGFVMIALLSLVVLRRPRDVALMLIPLVIAGVLTLGTMAIIRLPLNFANVIALPLLFSLGVSYAVYFVFFGRTGRRDFLQSSMARAVLFSAATVLVAFASLCFSSHPGTQGMGKLLTIALYYCLVCTFFVLPVLYGFVKKDSLSSLHPSETHHDY